MLGNFLHWNELVINAFSLFVKYTVKCVIITVSQTKYEL